MPAFLKLGETALIPSHMQKIETSRVVYLVVGTDFQKETCQKIKIKIKA